MLGFFFHIKDEAWNKLKIFWKLLENKSGCYLKTLRSDKSGKYISNNFEEYYKLHEIWCEIIKSYIPQQNGCVE
jgi:hypothetical protein